ncbi:hypothetical protein FE249_15975 [Acidiphilium multivorum]|uniref:hypothetical protein n=1 Tax=Acidiphilium multivorum TaxID=62140 RepID=UPI001F4C1DEE|nr:hypothetical protein [Acidiphilium multivorum]UNC15610.1 hypothetical protein FE249_15975 [Acidiphilium multivorum]
MIQNLLDLDNRSKIGVIARTAIALEDQNNPAAFPILENEEEIRAILLANARSNLGILFEDSSVEAIEKIGDWLDRQADDLMGPPDIDAALLRLAQGGTLPSDMYELDFDPSLKNWLGKRYDFEESLIRTTILRPDIEQHFGPSSDIHVPSLVSLFLKNFTTKWPQKDFGLLVVSIREGLRLRINQAWRIYRHVTDIKKSDNLIDVLRLFSQKFGVPFEWEGRKSSFFITTNSPIANHNTYKYGLVKKGHTFAFTQMQHRQNGSPTSQLVVSIDITEYVEFLDKMSVKRNDILTKIE